jgi:hypothetical protein
MDVLNPADSVGDDSLIGFWIPTFLEIAGTENRL